MMSTETNMVVGLGWAVVDAPSQACFSSRRHCRTDYATTFAVLFAVAVVFAVARIKTKALLLPIALHAESALLALLLSKIY